MYLVIFGVSHARRPFRLQSSALRHRVVWYVFADVSEESTLSIFGMRPKMYGVTM